jgi:NO-binding membrane sensor protein with MHYT domain
MHYLGDAGISNYVMKYSITRVVASVIIAISATNVALALFFIMHKNFTNLWWKRLILAFILAGAVSGMHWTASSGTTYMIKRKQAISDNTLSRQWVVVIVIVLVCSFSSI